MTKKRDCPRKELRRALAGKTFQSTGRVPNAAHARKTSKWSRSEQRLGCRAGRTAPHGWDAFMRRAFVYAWENGMRFARCVVVRFVVRGAHDGQIDHNQISEQE